MSTSIDAQNKMKKMDLFYDDKDNLHYINSKVDDVIYDIALGITNNQTLDYEDKITLENKKKQKRDFKTNLIKETRNIINDELLKIHESYRWKGEHEFNCDERHIKLIDYPTYGDSCDIQFDYINKNINITKKDFREWYEAKTK